MAWFKSVINGCVFEVLDDAQVRYFEAQGHEVSDSDPRLVKPKAVKPKSDKE